MSDERDSRRPASVMDGNVNGTVRCPICEGLHLIKRDRNGNEFVTLSCIGTGSNIFPRTPFGKEALEKWKRAAHDNPIDTVSKTVPTEEHRASDTKPSVRPKGSDELPRKSLNDLVKRLQENRL